MSRRCWAVLGCLVAAVGVGAAEPFPAPANARAVEAYAGKDAPAVMQHLRHHGFTVLGDRVAYGLADAYHLHLADVPVLVTSDALLHTWYEVERNVGEAVERERLSPLSKRFATAAWASHQALERELAGAPPEVRGAGTTAGLALAVALRLADAEAPLPETMTREVEATVAKIRAATATKFYPGEDYTQYRPRGPYDDHAALAAYFRLAKWLGRRLIPLEGDEATPAAVRQAAWLTAVVQRDAQVRELWRRLTAGRKLLAGPFALSSVDELDRALTKVLGERWSPAVLTDEACRRVVAELAGPGYTNVDIVTRLLDPGQHFPTRAFALLPEHELPDSRLFQQVIHEGREPSGMQVAAALGVGRAAEHVAADPALAKLTAEARAAWRAQPGSLFERWLELLGALQPSDPRAPAFMRTVEWQDKTMVTALASWAQLRHQAVLYSALAGAPGGAPMQRPKGLVEPNVAFLNKLAELAAGFRRALAEVDLVPGNVHLLDELAAKAKELAGYAELELAGMPLPDNGESLLHFDRWLRGLIDVDPVTIADVANLYQPGREVLLAGSGELRPMLALMPTPGGETVAALGYTSSYYEFAASRRLTDDEWQARLRATYAKPTPPEWARSFWLTAAGADPEATAALRAAESELLAGRDEAGVAAIRRFQAAHRGTELEARAQHLLVVTYARRRDWRAVLEAAEAATSMYGCSARDEATQWLKEVRGTADLDAEREEQPSLEEVLGATDARPGLSPAEEQARQDRRAELLLRPPRNTYASPQPGRVLEECPRSALVPVAKLYLADGAERGWWSPGDHHGLADPAALEAVEREYPGSLVAETAAAWAVEVLAEDDPVRALAKLAAYLPPHERKGERQPAAAAFLAGGDGDGAPPPPGAPPREQAPVRTMLRAYQTSQLAEQLLKAGRLDELGRLLALIEADPEAAREHEDDHTFALYRQIGTKEPDALRRWMAAARAESDAERVAPLQELVKTWPNSTLTPHALRWLLNLLPADSPGAREAAALLQARYPKSIQALGLRADALAREGRLDEAAAVLNGLGYPEPAPWLACLSATAGGSLLGAGYYFGDDLRGRNRYVDALSPYVDMTRADRLRLGAELYTKGEPSAAWRDEMLRRAGTRAQDVLVALVRLRPYDLALQDRLVRDYPQHPLAEKLAWRKRLQQGPEAMATVVDAGPAAPHYAEAVQQLEVLTMGPPTGEAAGPPMPLDPEDDPDAGPSEPMAPGPAAPGVPAPGAPLAPGPVPGRPGLAAADRSRPMPPAPAPGRAAPALPQLSGSALDSVRERYEALATAHQGKPSATLALAAVGEAMLRNNWPEQALAVLTRALAEPPSPFAARAAADLAQARKAVAAPRGPRHHRLEDQPGAGGAGAAVQRTPHADGRGGQHALRCAAAGTARADGHRLRPGDRRGPLAGAAGQGADADGRRGQGGGRPRRHGRGARRGLRPAALALGRRAQQRRHLRPRPARARRGGRAGRRRHAARLRRRAGQGGPGGPVGVGAARDGPGPRGVRGRPGRRDATRR